MEIKDFKVNDDCYILQENMGCNTQPTITKYVVDKVGRKYVTVRTAWESKFEKAAYNEDGNYLIEACEIGEKRKLFKTRCEVEEYIERKELALWLGCISTGKAEKYTLEQLRKVKEILEPK